MLYFSTDQPWRRATVVLDSSTPDRLRVIDPERSAAAADARRGG
jgi:hypothetical protein